MGAGIPERGDGMCQGPGAGDIWKDACAPALAAGEVGRAPVVPRAALQRNPTTRAVLLRACVTADMIAFISEEVKTKPMQPPPQLLLCPLLPGEPLENAWTHILPVLSPSIHTFLRIYLLV